MIVAVARRGTPVPAGFDRILWIRKAGEETECTRQALEDAARRIVAVGGDGFLRNAAAAFFDGRRNVFPERALAIVPAGTGNDVALMLRIPNEPHRAAQVARNGFEVAYDVAFAGDRLFLNIAQVGVGAAAVRAANAWGKR
jgi:diacylglycerol kinase family enzyme